MMRFATAKEELLFSLRYPLVRRSLAALMASIILLAGVSMFYWWPARGMEASLNEEIAGKRREIADAEFTAQLVRVSRHAMSQVAQMERKLDAAVTQAALVQNLGLLAQESNVKIVSESYEEGQPEAGYLPLVHGVTLQGAYPDIRNFITGLQGLPTFTVVKGAVFGLASGSGDIRVQLNMVTYRKMIGSNT
ncbi:MAG TPA: hypothetical protein VFP33_02045 [Gallionella sp.]|nr:hypothetical protein [Gallionella sp.]